MSYPYIQDAHFGQHWATRTDPILLNIKQLTNHQKKKEEEEDYRIAMCGCEFQLLFRICCSRRTKTHTNKFSYCECVSFFLCTHNSNTSEIQYSQMITWRRIQTSMRPNGIFAILCRVRAFLVRLCDNDHHQPIAYTHTQKH